MGKRCFVLLGVILLLCLSACGGPKPEERVAWENASGQGETGTQEENETQTVPADQETSEGVQVVLTDQETSEGMQTVQAGQERNEAEGMEQRAYDWRTEEWKLEEEGDWGHNLYAAEYIYGLESQPAAEYVDRSGYHCILGNRIYSIEEFSVSEEEYEGRFYYMNCFDSITGEIWHRPLELPDLPELEQYGECDAYYQSFDMCSEQEMVVFLLVRAHEGEQETVAYLAVHMSLEGEVLSVLDLYPALLEGGAQDCTCGVYWHSPGHVYVDREGFYYLIPVSWENRDYGLSGRFASEIPVLDPEGELVGRMKPWAGHSPRFVMKTPDGEPIFLWYTGSGINSYALMYYDKAAQEQRQLLKIREPLWDTSWVSMLREDGYLYFMDGKGRLNRCDLSTGKREYCLGYGKLGLGDWPGHVSMVQGPDGEPIFLDTLEGDVICRLGTEEPENDPVYLVSLTEDCSFLEKQAQRFSKGFMEHPVEVEKPTGDAEDFRTRKMAELVSGKGADIYYVSAADMEILYENGVLADMTGMLPAELEEAVYPGVLDGGILDGQRVGLAPEARAVTMLVSEEYWDGEKWTLEELLNMVDAHPELEYPIICGQQYLDGYRLLNMLLFQDLDSSPFLDLRRGDCDFENPLFIKLLELVKRYYDRPVEITREGNMPRELLETGDYAAIILIPWDFPDFNQIMSMVKEDCRQVGLPTEEGTGCYWQTDYYLVVNRKAGNKEVAYAYLAYLLEEKSQNSTRQPVRQDLLKQHVVADDTNPDALFYSDDKGGYFLLETGPDGSAWQEEYERMQSRSVLVTTDTEDIQQIIMEEAENYFTGVRDAQAVAGLIQNRVQLYLKEQGTEESQSGKGGRMGARHNAG